METCHGNWIPAATLPFTTFDWSLNERSKFCKSLGWIGLTNSCNKKKLCITAKNLRNSQETHTISQNKTDKEHNCLNNNYCTPHFHKKLATFPLKAKQLIATSAPSSSNYIANRYLIS